MGPDAPGAAPVVPSRSQTSTGVLKPELWSKHSTASHSGNIAVSVAMYVSI